MRRAPVHRPAPLHGQEATPHRIGARRATRRGRSGVRAGGIGRSLPRHDPPHRRTASRTSSRTTSAGLGYGYGYAFAQDNICVDRRHLRDRRRASARGTSAPTARTRSRGNGASTTTSTPTSSTSGSSTTASIENLLALAAAARARGPRSSEGVRGYVAGYNRYLRDTGVDNLPDPRCRGKPWVQPITEMDAYRRFYQLGAARQPGRRDRRHRRRRSRRPAPVQPPTPAEQQQMIGELKQQLPLGGIGSNAIGARQGRDRQRPRACCSATRTSRGTGSERFYQAQLTIPGKLNVAGGSLFGVPLVLIGHTRQPRLEPHGLDRLPLHAVRGDARARLADDLPVDGQPQQMKARRR